MKAQASSVPPKTSYKAHEAADEAVGIMVKSLNSIKLMDDGKQFEDIPRGKPIISLGKTPQHQNA